MSVDLRLGDCRELLKTLPDCSIDAIVCDPPYPCIKRPYGCLTEAEWWDLMMAVCKEARRVLKPTGSAVFVLQPNSRKVGSMRGWLFEFQAWACREWNMVQDAWWWNTTAMPLTKNDPDALRSSIKACVWLGPPDCHRDASGVRWAESDVAAASRQTKRCYNQHRKVAETRANVKYDRFYEAAPANGGVTPFNLLPISAGGPRNPSDGHGAPTPIDVCDWWVRYISPPDGVVCDPFMGSGTVGLAALRRGRSFVGFEQMPEYFDIAERRLAAESARHPLLEAAR